MLTSFFRWSRPEDVKSFQPTIPRGKRLYVCGDVHGRLDALDRALDRIEDDISSSRAGYIIVFLGDYIDRGPESAYVIERLLQVRQTHECVCLKGNHEAMFLGALKDSRRVAPWLGCGGLATLASYGVAATLTPSFEEAARIRAEFRSRIPVTHLGFLEQLDCSYACGDYFFVHAGIKPGRSLDSQREDDLLWIRAEFLQSAMIYDKIIVHGHTPVTLPDIKPNRINIDTGAYATGNLTCLVLEEGDQRFV